MAGPDLEAGGRRKGRGRRGGDPGPRGTAGQDHHAEDEAHHRSSTERELQLQSGTSSERDLRSATERHTVFVTGGSGYVGRALLPALLARGHAVRALVRPGSEQSVPTDAVVIRGDALEATTFADAIAPADTVVHLVGVSRPSPLKAAQFLTVDLASIRATMAAIRGTPVRHVVYLSVAQPAPVMRAYIAARREGEALVLGGAMPATFVRPWYVLGPGHRWPAALVPLYAALERLPSTREGARRLGLVTRPQLVAALVQAVEHPPDGVRVLDVPAIRVAGTV